MPLRPLLLTPPTLMLDVQYGQNTRECEWDPECAPTIQHCVNEHLMFLCACAFISNGVIGLWLAAFDAHKLF